MVPKYFYNHNLHITYLSLTMNRKYKSQIALITEYTFMDLLIGVHEETLNATSYKQPLYISKPIIQQKALSEM